MAFVILNGGLLDAEQAALRIDDRGFLLGDGLFETMRAYDGRVFRLEAHLERLARSRAAFRLDEDYPPAELAQLVERLLAANELADARVRITLTRGRHAGGMYLYPASPLLLITAAPMPAAGPASAGLTLAYVGVRFSEHNPIFRHKTLNRLPHLLARTEAAQAGADEALILDERGNVATASTGNLFAVYRGQLFTPPLAAPILPGITRAEVLRLARSEGIPIREDFFSPLMLAGVAEAFLANSVSEIVPIVKVDANPIGSGQPGPVTATLQKLYRALVQP
jgi:branched-chain amino acid aminotransferase